MTLRHLVGATVLVLMVAGPVGLDLRAARSQAPDGGHRFVTHTIASLEEGGYQPVVVDLNRDDRPDVIALSVGLDELAWYENPGWERHVITTGLNRSINLAPQDLDGDGVPELVIAHEFGTSHEGSLGVLTLLTHQGDPTQPWRAREIDRAPTAHRLRWADMDGSGQRVLVNAPLVGPAASSPEYQDDTPIYWYDPSDWSRHLVTGADGGVVHGLLVTPWDDPGGRLSRAGRGVEAGGHRDRRQRAHHRDGRLRRRWA